MNGGKYGYPDATYIDRMISELKQRLSWKYIYWYLNYNNWILIIFNIIIRYIIT